MGSGAFGSPVSWPGGWPAGGGLEATSEGGGGVDADGGVVVVGSEGAVGSDGVAGGDGLEAALMASCAA